MKKFIVLFMMVLAMMSCADSKTFERADGTKFVAETTNLIRLKE